ncbi:hypothetical protein L218DRAFT_1002264 [Marasmius fiardii PR-910]|nr:hypothetical protein L218DRAFT_1002264 [Marasmius fiardii PR-910]
MTSLPALPTDVLITIFSLLSIPDILNFRQTNRQFHTLSKQQIVWINARKAEILDRSWPCETPRVGGGDDEERTTRNAWRLGRRWASISGSGMLGMPVRRERRWMTNTSTAVSDVRFLVVKGRKMVLTVSKGIWSVLTLWDVDERDDEKTTKKLDEWSPRGGLFTGLAINEDEGCEEKLAISVAKEGTHETLLLTVDTNLKLKPTLRIPSPQGASPLRAISFSGSMLALADDISHTTIFDWKSGGMAILAENVDDETEGSTSAGIWKHNSPIQIVFAPQSILVVRARSLSLFQQPSLSPSPSHAYPEVSATEHFRVDEEETAELHSEHEGKRHLSPHTRNRIPSYTPIATHSFGWVDGIHVAFTSPKVSSSRSDLQIFVRAENDNPWRSDEGSIDVYALRPNPAFDIAENENGRDSSSFTVTLSHGQSTQTESASSPPLPPVAPYIFPPYPITSLPTPRGSLRCTTLRAGRAGTALWICPRPPSFASPSIHSTIPNLSAGLVVDQWAVDGLARLEHDHPGERGEYLDEGGGYGLVDGNEIDFGVDIYGIGIGTGVGASVPSSISLPTMPRGESLIAGVFPGPFNPLESDSTPSSLEPKMKVVLGTELNGNGWTAMDYDEVTGRVGLGFGDGSAWVGWF